MKLMWLREAIQGETVKAIYLVIAVDISARESSLSIEKQLELIVYLRKGINPWC